MHYNVRVEEKVYGLLTADMEVTQLISAMWISNLYSNFKHGEHNMVNEMWFTSLAVNHKIIPVNRYSISINTPGFIWLHLNCYNFCRERLSLANQDAELKSQQ